MDPQEPNSFRHRFTYVNGIVYHFVDQGEGHDNVIILCHGFPDLWYGWRYQIPFLVSKGYRVIAPDLRGFGQTEAPHCPPNDIHQYGFKNICKDLSEIMNQLNFKKAIFMGHDWGGFVGWRMCIHYPEKVRAVISLSTPYVPPTEHYLNIESVAELLPNLQYQVYFTHPKAEIEFDSNPELFFKAILRSSKKEDRVEMFDGNSMLGIVPSNLEKSPMITDKELDYYVSQYKARGFHGGLNYYKTRKVNFQDEKGARKQIHHPALMVTLGGDTFIPPSMTRNMHKYCKDLTIKIIPDSSHWVMFENAQKLHEIIEPFLDSIPQKELQNTEKISKSTFKARF
ncbi:Alpha/Beta hydrolase protein [Glomus cerebriforme]|uniref:Alpha/Beta hydrolase protein n=1 Tax=Glomus cerebriforme TaxID=658196 RepID=A0A397SFC2_9GLOM|nr:Alpha/Beta hydrolase protein [Glomus cerebriforme]